MNKAKQPKRCFAFSRLGAGYGEASRDDLRAMKLNGIGVVRLPVRERVRSRQGLSGAQHDARLAHERAVAIQLNPDRLAVVRIRIAQVCGQLDLAVSGAGNRSRILRRADPYGSAGRLRQASTKKHLSKDTKVGT